MDTADLVRTVLSRAGSDEWYLRCCENVRRHEPNYQAILSQLTEEQQDQLELYIGACEARSEAYMFTAYRLGKEHGRMLYQDILF